MLLHCLLFLVMFVNIRSRYLSSAFLLLVTNIVVKIVGAVYKIPLTTFIGGVGRGYFATAYNLCMPIHAITMGAFPIALSRLVSEYNAVSDTRMVQALKLSSYRVFFAVGAIGTGIMIVFAVPYSRLIASSPDSIYTILVLAPSILFSSMAAAYRGYYEGYMNMVPTSVSQGIEAVIKLVFGLLFAKYSMNYLYMEFALHGTVLGAHMATESMALSRIYPLTSAAAILGVTFGTAMSLLFCAIYSRVNDTTATVPRAMIATARQRLITFSFPIMVSCGVQSVFQFLDTASVQYSLANMSQQRLSAIYSHPLSIANVAANDVPTYVYGLLSTSLDFKNLIPSITMALGVCAVPAISGALHLGDRERLISLVNSVYRYTIIISVYGGLGLATFSREILDLFYGRSAVDIVDGCADITRYFGYTAFAYSCAGVVVFVVQAIGKPEKSIAPYIISGIVRVGLNLCLIPRLALLGSVVSGAVGYVIMLVLNLVIIRRYANIRVDLKDTVVKPAFVCVITVVSWRYLSTILAFGSQTIFGLVTKMVAFSALFFALCFATKLLRANELPLPIMNKKEIPTTCKE